MRKSPLSALLCLFAFMMLFSQLRPVSAVDLAADGVDHAALDSAITSQMSKHGLPGVAVAVVEADGTVYLKAYGKDGDGAPLTVDSPMFIGSQSKSFTALAIVQLAEAGKLDLNAPVQTYIPWFSVADAEASKHITLNHLLHHTSGLADAGYAVLLPLDTNLEVAVRSLNKAELTAPIGTRFQYFNMGYSVLAYVIEQVSGESYASYIQTHVFDPLGMNSTTADPARMPVVRGYSRLFGFAIPMQQPVEIYAVSAGYILSTVTDMAKYASAMLQPDCAGLITPEMRNLLLSPDQSTYAMGWFVVDDGSKIFHGGANEAFRSEVNLYPSRGRAFVLLTNEGHQLDHFISASQLTAAVESVVLGESPRPVTQVWSVRWIGWGIGIFVLGLVILIVRNFRDLRGWKARVKTYSRGKRIFDVAISFLIPVAITMVVLWQIGQFYGNRFNLLTSMAYMRLGLPDVCILMIIGTVPDLLQGFIKLGLLLKRDKEPVERPGQ